ncbi:hypothetical protein [Wenyingzhuangia sp. IMCC45574]
MKPITILFTFFFSVAILGQDLAVKRIVEYPDVYKKTKKVYTVLEKHDRTRHGDYKEYYKRDLVVSGVYEYGQKTGSWIYKDPEGDYLQKGSFKKGKESGKWEKYYKGNLIGEVLYNDNGVVIESKYYDIDGNVTGDYYYDEFLKIGKGYREYLNGAKVEYMNYGEDKVNHGDIKVFYPNGFLLQEKKYNKGKLFWVSNIYKNDGTVARKVVLNNGKGQDIDFFIDELICKGEFIGKTVTTYKDSIPNGRFLEYNKEGDLRSMGYLFKSEKVGDWKVWSSKKKQLVGKKYKKLTQEKIDKNYTERALPYINGTNLKPVLLMQNRKEKKGNKFHKKEFSATLNKFFAKNVDTKYLASLLDSSNSSQVHRVACIFKINVYGEVDDVKVRAKKNQKLVKRYVTGVLNKAPTFIPAHVDYRFVNLKFSLPIVFRVE